LVFIRAVAARSMPNCILYQQNAPFAAKTIFSLSKATLQSSDFASECRKEP
jgi:hypothetical protein